LQFTNLAKIFCVPAFCLVSLTVQSLLDFFGGDQDRLSVAADDQRLALLLVSLDRLANGGVQGLVDVLALAENPGDVLLWFIRHDQSPV
jgi:hypothetical protein